jgi:hypothetical protein
MKLKYAKIITEAIFLFYMFPFSVFLTATQPGRSTSELPATARAPQLRKMDV